MSRVNGADSMTVRELDSEIQLRMDAEIRQLRIKLADLGERLIQKDRIILTAFQMLIDNEPGGEERAEAILREAIQKIAGIQC